MTTAARWGLPALWLVLALVAGPTLGDGLDGAGDGVRTGASVALWLLWVVGLATTLVPRTMTLTPVRVLLPASLPAVAWAVAAGGDPDALDVLALALAAAVAGLSLTAWVGDVFVDGDSYGDERRLLLRPPGPLLLGPIPLAWLVVVGGVVAGPLLILDGAWAVGPLVLALGWPAAAVAARALHALTQRFLVFVPGGLVVHDRTALAVPVLLRRGRVVALGLAPAGTDALDLTRGSLGTALEVRLAEPERLPVVRRSGPTQERADDVEADALLVAPSRPAVVVAEAQARRLAPQAS